MIDIVQYFTLDLDLWRLVLVMAAPLAIAAVGELVAERSGVLNVSIEGMMAVGAAAGFVATFETGSYAAGVLAGMAAGGLMALVLAYYAVTVRAPQITVGLSLFVLGLGASSLLYRIVVGVRLVPPRVQPLPSVDVPGLAGLPILGDLLFRHNVLVYVALALVPVVSVLLFRTPLGLRLRAAGESPRAVDVLGLSVSGLRYLATVVAGLLIGLAGAYLPLAVTGSFGEGMVGGRGWIALMLVIFGRWRPSIALAGALLFAYVEAVEFKTAILTRAVPPQFLRMVPYLFAVLVLVRVYRGARAPRALGVPYYREART